MANSQCGTLERRKNSFGRELGDVGGGGRGGRSDLGDPGGTRRGDLGEPGGARRGDLGEPGGARRGDLVEPVGARARGTSTFRSLPRNNSQLEVITLFTLPTVSHSDCDCDIDKKIKEEIVLLINQESFLKFCRKKSCPN